MDQKCGNDTRFYYNKDMDENLELVTQNTEDPKSNKGNLISPPHTRTHARTHVHTHTHRERDRERTERDRETQRDRERDRETDTHRQTDRQTERVNVIEL